MVKENYYQEFIDLFEAEKAAATAASDTPRTNLANTGLTYFEGQMDTWCKQGFTTKVLPDYEQTKTILYDAGNTKVVLGDHTIYFDKIYTKDNCKVKICSLVKDSNNQADGTYGSNFEVPLVTTKYTWKIQKKDYAAGLVYPDYKMKCIIDINLGGASATTHTFYGAKVAVTQVVNCATVITSPITTYTFPKRQGTCDNSVNCASFLTTKVIYEKEFYFFNDFTIPNSDCGTLTYAL